MHYTSIITISVAWFTWIGFAAAMRYYFRCARQKNFAKTFLTLSAFASTLSQLVVLGLSKPPNRLQMWAGLACFSLANSLFWWALAAHGKLRPAFAFIDIKPASFTQSGPYQWIRHPIYTAYLLGWLAGPFVTGQAWLLMTVAWMGILYYAAARQEEKHFANTIFRRDYAQYQKRTGMFLPKPITL